MGQRSEILPGAPINTGLKLGDSRFKLLRSPDLEFKRLTQPTKQASEELHRNGSFVATGGGRIVSAVATLGELTALVAFLNRPGIAYAENTAVQNELNSRPTAGSTFEAVGLSRQSPQEITIPDVSTEQQAQEVAGVEAAPPMKTIPMPDGRTFYTEDGVSGFAVRNADVVVQDGDWPVSREWNISGVETVQAFKIAGLLRRYPTEDWARGGFGIVPFRVRDMQEALNQGLIPADALIPEKLPSSSQDEALSPPPGTIDVLALPGWPANQEFFSLRPDGSIQIQNPNSSELTIVNSPRSTDAAPVQVGLNGFEATVKMHTVPKTIPDHPAAGFVRFYNKPPFNPEGIWPQYLEIGFDPKGNLKISFDTRPNGIKILAWPQDKNIASGNLKIRLTGNRGTERLSLWDASTGELLVDNLRLPMVFFEGDTNDLRPGFYVVSYDRDEPAVMTIDEFKIELL